MRTKASETLPEGGVRLYQDQSLCKETDGGITPAYADRYYWPFASDRAITAWIPPQAVPGAVGPLGFFAGSQIVEFGRDLGSSDDSERAVNANMEARGLKIVDEPF